MASTVVWECIKRHNAHLVKTPNSRITFSRERGNLRNINTFKSSGLAHNRVVDVRRAEKGVILRIKSPKVSRSRLPARSFDSTVLKQHFRRSHRAISKRLRGYRPDLRRAALARMSALVSFFICHFQEKKDAPKRTANRVLFSTVRHSKL